MKLKLAAVLFSRRLALAALLLLARIASAEPAPASFAYLLQADAFAGTEAAAVESLAASGRDWVVLDAAFDGSSLWSREELHAIRAGQPGRKVIAYISIGEAEDYRPYWRKEWASQTAPAWLLTENPRWKGNYRVKYWDAGWQKLILAAVDDAMDRGFDGVYLDIVDGFETFEQDGRDFIDNRMNPETKQTYRRDMVDWVKAIAARARSKNPAAIVIPQNGSQLLAQDDFLGAISGIGIEDLFTHGNKSQRDRHIDPVLADLKKIADAKKPVLVIEYPKDPELRETAKKQAHASGFTWLMTDRNLKTLGESGI